MINEEMDAFGEREARKQIRLTGSKPPKRGKEAAVFNISYNGVAPTEGDVRKVRAHMSDKVADVFNSWECRVERDALIERAEEFLAAMHERANQKPSGTVTAAYLIEVDDARGVLDTFVRYTGDTGNTGEQAT